MCLTIDYSKHPKRRALIAKQDIFTLKIAFLKSKNTTESYYQGTKQKLNELQKATMRARRGDVSAGLHSIVDEIFFDKYLPFDARGDEKRSVILCKIPKGSTYWLGRAGDIVSNQLVLIEPIVVNDASQKYLPQGNFIGSVYKLERKTFKLAKTICKSHNIKIGI